MNLQSDIEHKSIQRNEIETLMKDFESRHGVIQKLSDSDCNPSHLTDEEEE